MVERREEEEQQRDELTRIQAGLWSRQPLCLPVFLSFSFSVSFSLRRREREEEEVRETVAVVAVTWVRKESGVGGGE